MVNVARSHPFGLDLFDLGGLGAMVRGSTAVARSRAPGRERIPAFRGAMKRIVFPIELFNIVLLLVP